MRIARPSADAVRLCAATVILITTACGRGALPDLDDASRDLSSAGFA